MLSIFPADQRNNVGIRGDELFLGATKIGGYSDGRFLVDHKLAKPAVKLMPLFTALLEEKGTVVFYEITASSITVCAGKELGKKNIFYPLV